MNIIIFGVNEDRDLSTWRRSVDDILKFIVGHDIALNMYRIGRYSSDKSRPILVKLRSEWDKRLILKTSRKLKSYPGRIFVWPDEPLETRRKRTFERLKYRAEREGKAVASETGVLLINGVAAFSLRDGLIPIQNGQ
jgi:hypothetical protein